MSHAQDLLAQKFSSTHGAGDAISDVPNYKLSAIVNFAHFISKSINAEIESIKIERMGWERLFNILNGFPLSTTTTTTTWRFFGSEINCELQPTSIYLIARLEQDKPGGIYQLPKGVYSTKFWRVWVLAKRLMWKQFVKLFDRLSWL